MNQVAEQLNPSNEALGDGDAPSNDTSGDNDAPCNTSGNNKTSAEMSTEL